MPGCQALIGMDESFQCTDPITISTHPKELFDMRQPVLFAAKNRWRMPLIRLVSIEEQPWGRLKEVEARKIFPVRLFVYPIKYGRMANCQVRMARQAVLPASARLFDRRLQLFQ
jgi:hypothetical protein